jgi:hypothetical protein
MSIENPPQRRRSEQLPIVLHQSRTGTSRFIM